MTYFFCLGSALGGCGCMPLPASSSPCWPLKSPNRPKSSPGVAIPKSFPWSSSVLICQMSISYVWGCAGVFKCDSQLEANHYKYIISFFYSISISTSFRKSKRPRNLPNVSFFRIQSIYICTWVETPMLHYADLLQLTCIKN